MYQVLFDVLAMIGKPNEIADFLDDVLSPTEKTMIAKRLFIAILLARGFTYEQIEGTLKVSSPTVRNVNIALKHGKYGYVNAINKIVRHEKVQAFLDVVGEGFLQLASRRRSSYDHPLKSRIGKAIYEHRKKRLFVK